MDSDKKYRLTDTGNAERLAQLYGEKIRYDHLRGQWLVWRKHYWQEDEDGLIYRLATKTVRKLYNTSADIDDIEHRRQLAKWAINSEQRLRIESSVALAKNLMPIADSGKDWDNDHWLFALKNGVINLKTGKLRAGLPEDRLRFRSDLEYDHNARCPRWIQFLSEVFCDDNELIDYIWRLCGYSLTGFTKEQVYAICYGKGANGKGRFFAAIRHVLGDYSYNAPFSTFELTNRTSIPNDLAALERRRLVTSSETNENTRLNEARLKSLSGEDPITARYLHREFFTFMPACKIWLAVNHKPRVQDDSYGFWRRVRLIPFDREFKGENDDKDLGKKLQAEAPGILNWLIEGCLEWQRRGLDPTPIRVTNATSEYEAESDPLTQFIDDCCVVKPNAMVKAGDLYKAYLKWTQEQGLSKAEVFTSNAFGRRMGTKFNKRHSEHGQLYYGLGILTDNRSGSSSSSIPPSVGKEYKMTDNRSAHQVNAETLSALADKYSMTVEEVKAFMSITDEEVMEFIKQLRDKPSGNIF